MEESLSAKRSVACPVAVLTGAAAALALLLVSSLVAGAAVYFSPLSETVLSPIALALDGAVALGGGFIAGRRSGRRGLVMGAAVGVILLALMLFLPLSADGGSGPLLKTAVCLPAALIGGVLGVR